MIIFSIDKAHVIGTNFFDLADKEFSRNTNIDIAQSIRVENALIFENIGLECIELISQIGIDILLRSIRDDEVLKCEEYPSSILQGEMNLIFFTEVSDLSGLEIGPLLLEDFDDFHDS